MNASRFHKRYFKKIGEFFRKAKEISKAGKKLKRITPEDNISSSFSEKIMLAVTGVNNCVYCSYLHTKTALEHGVTDKEIQAILQGEFGTLPPDEVPGLLYAQHWTETGGNPTPKARNEVVTFYGENKTASIEYYMQLVNIGNLVSNTVEGYKRKAVPERGKFSFLLTYLLCLPIASFIKRGGLKHRHLVKNDLAYLKDNDL